MQPSQTPPLPMLPLQMMLNLGTWTSSPSAFRNASAAWQPWKPPGTSLPGLNGALAEAIANEAKNRAASFLSGISRYLETPYVRSEEEPPAIWRRGNARLLDYGRAGGEAPVVLFIPSLINRYYILDLDRERSLLRYLAGRGLHPLALDWGEPGTFEKDFDCGKYITEILIPAIEFLHQTTGRPVTLAGYCMGGVLALAAAQLLLKKVKALALLATPWDFHCNSFKPLVVDARWHSYIESLIMEKDKLPAEIIQSLFYWSAPFVFEQKFRRFAGLAKESRAAEEFVALEHWVNDGVPMTANLARECLVDWAQRNQLVIGNWKVGNERISPKKIKAPTLIAIPKNDHIVPGDCAMPLAEALPKAQIIHPGGGHVGMIVGSGAEKELWEKLKEWLQRA